MMSMYSIHMGIPEMKAFWDDLVAKNANGTASRQESDLYKKIGKSLRQLAENPRYPGLRTHDIEALTKRYGMKVWESYLENNNSRAARIFWVYGPNQQEITVIGIEPHPNDKSNAYKKITLSSTGDDI